MPRILLVEDEREVGRLMEHVLIAARYTVDRTDNVADGLDHLERYAYDLLITDARLPDGTGMEIADRAAENSTKALIVTGYAFQYPDLRRYDFLMKPVRPQELLDVVERLLLTSV